MQPSQCWAWAHTAAEHQHSLSLWAGRDWPRHLCPARGDSPQQQVPGCWDGMAHSLMGSMACRAGSSTRDSIRCSCVMGIDEIKVPVKSQHLFCGHVVQGGLVRLGQRRVGDRMCGVGSACQAGGRAMLWSCVWGRKCLKKQGSPGDFHRVFSSLGVYQQQELLVQKSLTGASYWKLLAANKYHLS